MHACTSYIYIYIRVYINLDIDEIYDKKKFKNNDSYENKTYGQRPQIENIQTIITKRLLQSTKIVPITICSGRIGFSNDFASLNKNRMIRLQTRRVYLLL